MTILKYPRDQDLHDEHGHHIDPAGDVNLKARMKRHLDQHARDGAGEVELAAQRKEWAQADDMVKSAEETRWEIRDSIVERWRVMYRAEGVSQARIAEVFGLDTKTLNDYIRHGRPSRRESRRGQ